MKLLSRYLPILVILVFLACQKNSDDESQPLSGRYIGTFVRSGMDTVNVSVFFSKEGHFEGGGNQSRYPAICRGSYSISDNRILIIDSCSWTADFDWTLIFNGEYQLERQGDQLRIWRSAGGVTDEYRIAPMSR